MVMEWQVAVIGGIGWFEMSACDRHEGKMRHPIAGNREPAKDLDQNGWIRRMYGSLGRGRRDWRQGGWWRLFWT